MSKNRIFSHESKGARLFATALLATSLGAGACSAVEYDPDIPSTVTGKDYKPQTVRNILIGKTMLPTVIPADFDIRIEQCVSEGDPSEAECNSIWVDVDKQTFKSYEIGDQYPENTK